MSSDDEDGSKDWQRCATWLLKCMILTNEQWETVKCVDHLAFFLRDGVLLCLLLNRLHPGAVDTKSFSQRPQMSQFLCLKNIRVFLQSCKKVFGVKENALFEASDLFEIKDFNKVINALSTLSKTKEAKKSGVEPFNTENDEVYMIMPSEDIDEDIYTDHIYGDASEDADEEVYMQLIDYQAKVTSKPTTMSHRDHCVKEILDTEKKYVDFLNMVVEKFMEPLKPVLPTSDSEIIFRHILDLRNVHRDLLSDLAKVHNSSSRFLAEDTIPGVFIKHKMNLVIYGKYCANITRAQDRVQQCVELARVKPIVEAASEEAKVKLRDLLIVPFQRILKYHLLIGQLLKDTDDQCQEKPVLEQALEEMQDLSMYVNEVKRDSENLDLIVEIENSISDLNKYLQAGTELKDYGRRLQDGEVKVKMPPKEKNFESRYAFLFDTVLLICRTKGYKYTYQDFIKLAHMKIEGQAPEKGMFCFKLISESPEGDADIRTFFFGFKTQDQCEKWKMSLELAQSNFMPSGCDSSGFKFRMRTFDQPTTCDVCKKLLKGVIHQGYRCANTGTSVHKECIKKAAAMKDVKSGDKVKATAQYDGRPPPLSRSQQPLQFNVGDVIVVQSVSGNWIQGRLNDDVGYFPRDRVRVLTTQVQKYEEAAPLLRNGGNERKRPAPPPKGDAAPKLPPARTSTVPQKKEPPTRPVGRKGSSEVQRPWFAGPMSRQVATTTLQDKDSGTFLIRFSPEKNEYALSVRYDGGREPVRHVHIYKDGRGYYLSQMVFFESLLKLIEYYGTTSLQESFPNLQTRLTTPYQQTLPAAVANEPGVIGHCIALYDYAATEPTQLSFSADDKIAILSKSCPYPLWWRGQLNGKKGFLPSNYVKEM